MRIANMWLTLVYTRRLEDEEKLVLTPFEKNLEVWRQLWRVVERSDILVQVVDARDPLCYRSEDLEDYAKYGAPQGWHSTTLAFCFS